MHAALPINLVTERRIIHFPVFRRAHRIGAQGVVLRGGSAGGNLRAGPDLNELWILDCRFVCTCII